MSSIPPPPKCSYLTDFSLILKKIWDIRTWDRVLNILKKPIYNLHQSIITEFWKCQILASCPPVQDGGCRGSILLDAEIVSCVRPVHYTCWSNKRYNLSLQTLWLLWSGMNAGVYMRHKDVAFPSLAASGLCRGVQC